MMLPYLGAGLGYRRAIAPEIFAHASEIDFVEVIAEHILDKAIETYADLAVLRRLLPIVVHSLGLSLGTATGPNRDHTTQLAKLLASLSPPWVSDHLAVTEVSGCPIGHLSPLPFSQLAVEAVVRNLRATKERLPVPLLVENIASPLRLEAELDEATFIARIAEGADVGLLLDVTNAFANAVNHNEDPYRFLGQLPMDRVTQIHIVGGSWHGGVYHDDHSHAVQEDIWQLLEWVCKRAPVRGVIVERDDHFPAEFRELLEEVKRARGALKKAP